MKRSITDKISYIETSSHPLSADIGIIEDSGMTWLFDVGNGKENIQGLGKNHPIVLSHFHIDHVGNIDSFSTNELYVSKETYKHIHRGTVVEHDIYVGNLHIFPLPSSHAKGCLGLEMDNYAFVGDALYGKSKEDACIYNTQHLKNEIAVLKGLKANYLLVSHLPGLVRPKEKVISALQEIYKKRIPNNPEIRVEEMPFH